MEITYTKKQLRKILMNEKEAIKAEYEKGRQSAIKEMQNLVIFPESWLNGHIVNQDLKLPIEKAREFFTGWTEENVKNLWSELKEILDTSLPVEEENNNDYLLANYHFLFYCVITSTECSKVWNDFLEKYYNLLSAPDFDTISRQALTQAFGTQYIDPPKDLLIQKRILALILLHVASKNDIIQARDIYWNIIYMRSPLEKEHDVKHALREQNRNAAKSKNKNWKELCIRMAKDGKKSGKYNNLKQAANDIFPKIQVKLNNEIKSRPLKRSEAVLNTPSGINLVTKWLKKEKIF